MDNHFAVIATWNGETYIEKCIQSLLETNASLRVVVVDNASTDRTVEIIHRVCPEAVLFCLSRNLGFGRANNIGIKYAYEQGAEHILLINQDAFVETDVVRRLVGLQRLNPEFGILTPLHLEGTGSALDLLFCQHISKTSGNRQLLNDALLGSDFLEIYTVEFINAAIWMLSRECIEKVGLFNPVFVHYGEDMEYADRMRFFDFRIGMVPSLRGFHARVQDRPVENVSVDGYLIKEKAIIRYRLSRHSYSLAFNFFSALSRIVSTIHLANNSFLVEFRIKATLLFTLLSCTPKSLRMKKIAYRGGRCFFTDTEQDRIRYLVPIH